MPAAAAIDSQNLASLTWRHHLPVWLFVARLRASINALIAGKQGTITVTPASMFVQIMTSTYSQLQFAAPSTLRTYTIRTTEQTIVKMPRLNMMIRVAISWGINFLVGAQRNTLDYLCYEESEVDDNGQAQHRIPLSTSGFLATHVIANREE
ncbi:hypothetical protein QC764_0088630 [Podospora pseudoanserina]|uniref:Uncharacterized protein n=1 Tax=Podospora pseudoanserina TaxID=2609844 RepID=A0ABR0HRR7_9PEZI|nr:hypothetical protein QC764_0088630 [Podospora pseudoanserina]